MWPLMDQTEKTWFWPTYRGQKKEKKIFSLLKYQNRIFLNFFRKSDFFSGTCPIMLHCGRGGWGNTSAKYWFWLTMDRQCLAWIGWRLGSLGSYRVARTALGYNFTWQELQKSENHELKFTNNIFWGIAHFVFTSF